MKKLLFFSICSFAVFTALAQRTVGLIDYQKTNTEGYVLFAPMSSTTTYLIDKCGEKVHQWTSSYRPGLSAYLLPDGSLLRTGSANNSTFTSGGNGGAIEKYDWNNNLLWSYLISTSNECQHHDAISLPNGNILAIVWDRYDSAVAVANGKNPGATNAYLWSEKIVELQPLGATGANVVWEWKLWDHLIQDVDGSKLNYGVISDHPELVDINYFVGPPTSEDWIHLNSIDYNASLDQILVSSHNLGEIWIIDHSTTTAQAATHTGGLSGKGGDLLYRWGNPYAYKRGLTSDKKLFGQHHATWIPSGYPNAGKIKIFNNGTNRPAGSYSSVDIIETPINLLNQYPIGATTAFLPDSLIWTYSATVPTDFYAANIGGAYPLLNGSFMITIGPSGVFFEIDSTKQTVWKYINPVNNAGIISQGSIPSSNSVFRCNYYPRDYSAFSGKSLTSQGEIELNPIVPSICDSLFSGIETLSSMKIRLVPNPASRSFTIDLGNEDENASVEIFNSLGEKVQQAFTNSPSTIITFNGKPGMYFVKISNGKESSCRNLIIY